MIDERIEKETGLTGVGGTISRTLRLRLDLEF